MAGKTTQLKDPSTGDNLYPVTTATNVYMTDNTVVETRINSLENRRAETDASNLTTTDVEKWQNVLDIDKTEKITLLYDKSSSDSNINWGQTAGIRGGNSLTSPKALGVYKILRYYVMFASIQTEIVDLDMTTQAPNLNTNTRRTCLSALCNDDTTSHYTCIVNGNISSNNIYMDIGFIKGTSYNGRNSNSGYYIYKIEGIN